MGNIFSITTQYQNNVSDGFSFHVYGKSYPPKSGKTGKINASRVHHYCMEGDSPIPMPLLIDGEEITVKELTPAVIQKHAGIVFSREKDENGLDILSIKGTDKGNFHCSRLRCFSKLSTNFWDQTEANLEIGTAPLSRANELRSSTQVDIQKSEVKIQSERRIQESEKRIQESEKRIQESERRIQKSERRILESDQESKVKIQSERRVQESERRIQESERRIQESERRIQESDQESKVKIQSERRIQESERRIQESERRESKVKIQDSRIGKERIEG